MRKSDAKKRQRIEAALHADPAQSNRSIGVELKVSHTTVSRIRNELLVAGHLADGYAPVNGHHPNLIEPAGPGNARAVKHGAFSEQHVAPLRQARLAELQERFTGVPHTLLEQQAERLAQLELLRDFTDGRGVVRNPRTGEVFAAASFAEKLRSAFERQHDRLVEIAREMKQVDPQAALDAHLSELASGRESS